MYIEKVRIENFKGIDSCEIQFKQGFNLIIGDNGVGKTSLLDALSVALGGFIAGTACSKTRHITQDDIRMVSESLGDGSYNIIPVTPVLIECSAYLDNTCYTWTRSRSSYNASRTTLRPKDISKIATAMSENSTSILPVINYQGARRTWTQSREHSVYMPGNNLSRSAGYLNSLVDTSDIKMLLNWCQKMELITLQKKKDIAEYTAVRHALLCFLRTMSDNSINHIFYDFQNEELTCLDDDNRSIPVRLLSAGYQSIIWMVLDIAYRMSVLNPDLRERSAETPGVVLIDEIDMHLHPKWQWKIVNALRTTFPNVQFIAATHAPIVIASCKDEHLIKINEGFSMEYGTTFYGENINDILDYRYDSTSIKDEIKELLNTFYNFLEKGDFDKAEENLITLKTELGEDNSAVIQAALSLDLERTVLED